MIVLSARFIHLYQGASDANAAEQNMASANNNMYPVFIWFLSCAMHCHIPIAAD